ncbi:MAG: polysaccharide deacetylase family protein [Bacteroidota bacterium]
MMLVYTDIITPRVNYAIGLVFTSVLNIPFKITEDKKEFDEYTLPKIAYTRIPDFFGIYIAAHNLLFDTHTKEVMPEADKNYVDFPRFFKSNSQDFLGYDIFAMTFYFATRYEEYQVSEKDNHQRFQAEKSISFKYKCLHIPFLNKAIHEFALKLKQEFPSLNTVKRTFNFISTIDIDNAFAYAHKGLTRNLGGLAKDVLSLKFAKALLRIKSNVNDQSDPYNTFDLINTLSGESKTALQYFVLIGDHSTYDKNPHHKNQGFRKLIKSLSVNHPIGLHPSYESYNEPEKIGVEKKRLEEITGKKVSSARCHFLRLTLPETYRTFIAEGITDDYTMIYASQSGFRTGLCTPFNWFDLEKNEPTNLMIHTSAIMEGTLRDYNKLSTEKAQNTALLLMQEVKKYGGEFISIFHNDSFVAGENHWIDVYKSILNESKS